MWPLLSGSVSKTGICEETFSSWLKKKKKKKKKKKGSNTSLNKSGA